MLMTHWKNLNFNKMSNHNYESKYPVELSCKKREIEKMNNSNNYNNYNNFQNKAASNNLNNDLKYSVVYNNRNVNQPDNSVGYNSYTNNQQNIKNNYGQNNYGQNNYGQNNYGQNNNLSYKVINAEEFLRKQNNLRDISHR